MEPPQFPAHRLPGGLPGATAPPAARPPARSGGPQGGADFQAVLADRLQAGTGVRFSKHALARLERRQIDMSPQDLARLESAVDKARAKGARESLVLLDDLALVVSVRNQTVITATDASSRKDNVFTNIDSAVIA